MAAFQPEFFADRFSFQCDLMSGVGKSVKDGPAYHWIGKYLQSVRKCPVTGQDD